MELLKFAAIDIGTNAMRLLINNVIEDKFPNKVSFIKESLIRLPIRLGEDVFKDGIIGEKKIEKLIKALTAYRLLMEIEEVFDFRACATSAMRQATNSQEVIEKVFSETGILINVISGKEEADLLYKAQAINLLDEKHFYLSVDLGGGSIELTLFSNQESIVSRSFEVGTVRFLNKIVEKKEVKNLKEFVQQVKKEYQPLTLIGSGGNINKLFKLSKNVENTPLDVKQIKKLHKQLAALSVLDRMKFFELNPDRADVIVPAAKIFLQVMKWSDVTEIFVPSVGLSDGIVKQLYLEFLLKR